MPLDVIEPMTASEYGSMAAVSAASTPRATDSTPVGPDVLLVRRRTRTPGIAPPPSARAISTAARMSLASPPARPSGTTRCTVRTGRTRYSATGASLPPPHPATPRPTSAVAAMPMANTPSRRRPRCCRGWESVPGSWSGEETIRGNNTRSLHGHPGFPGTGPDGLSHVAQVIGPQSRAPRSDHTAPRVGSPPHHVYQTGLGHRGAGASLTTPMPRRREGRGIG